MPQWREMAPVEDDLRVYRGQSMEGTLRFGDRLIVEPLRLTDVVLGDVVIYRGVNYEGRDEEIVHRVIRTISNGLLVQGDNNKFHDATSVNETNLVGRVSYVERDGKRFPVRSGLFVFLRTRVLRGWRHLYRGIWGFVRRMGRESYCRFREKDLVHLFWRPSFTKLNLTTEKGPIIKYVYRNRTVAWYRLDDGRFKCRKPYDLVLWKEMLGKQKEISADSG